MCLEYVQVCHNIESNTDMAKPREKYYQLRPTYRITQNNCILATGEPKVATYLRQCLSVSIQRGNAVLVMGTISHSTALEDFPYLVLFCFLPLLLLFMVFLSCLLFVILFAFLVISHVNHFFHLNNFLFHYI